MTIYKHNGLRNAAEKNPEQAEKMAEVNGISWPEKAVNQFAAGLLSWPQSATEVGRNIAYAGRVRVYEQDGVEVFFIDNEAVAIYLGGVATVELTLSEWRNINAELTAMEEVE